MQFKNAALFLSALPAVLATLPATLELFVYQDGVRIGCVNGYGKFITGNLACYPFRTQAVDATSDDRQIWASGYGTCSAESGTLECYEPEGAPSSFTLNGANLELVGTGTSFSANSKPDPADRTGVEIIIGDGGSEDFVLQVHGVSG